MGVTTLIGTADGTNHAAVMYCDTSGWPVGPIFEAPDAEEHIAAFLEWLGASAGGPVRAVLGVRGHVSGDGTDPRHWEDGDLGVLVSHWRQTYVGEDGWLLDAYECECGHHHLGPDGELFRGNVDGCVTCSCTEWKPGNRAAQVEADKEATNDAHVPG